MRHFIKNGPLGTPDATIIEPENVLYEKRLLQRVCWGDDAPFYYMELVYKLWYS